MFKYIHESIQNSVFCQVLMVYAPAMLLTASPWVCNDPNYKVVALSLGITTMVVLAFLYVRETRTFRKWEEFKEANP
jgi:hypothetical protein